ncbi:hypothetical protein RB614_03240 [Phytohabitans sp. ZYX-F-186]|uniref:Uncharacterized protein n=1 Tax=Phytohabitans maris TaxID=3071409 RepID=A0ABU0ZB23_9ACTN|nr:hypothetical protein [Phytohabitans sp. ZYX-F-186]MDQ7903527.1 hypothetical protein [Phytohabitans sp. ZYX-F-186]
MGEKQWNAATGRWEIDGVPIAYRVTWKVVDTGEEHTREFNDVDQGYEFHPQCWSRSRSSPRSDPEPLVFR